MEGGAMAGSDIDDWTNGRWADSSSSVEDLTPKFVIGFWAVPPGDRARSAPPEAIENVLRPSGTIRSLSVCNRCDVDDVAGREDELISYLRSLSAPVDSGTLRIGPSFRLSLELRSESTGDVIGFPCWDALGDMESFFAWLHGWSSLHQRPDQPFCDLDQGWIFAAVRRGPHVHFRSGDFEDLSEAANVSTPIAPFLARLDRAKETARVVMSALETALPAIS